MKSYALQSFQTKGRFHKVNVREGRDHFQHDRDRIIHSKAFRRLAHKTQVFIYHEGDHYRNRLTHSLEVAQITRAVARRLEVNEDLAELTALSHDLGHPPFGHAGEEALNAKMKEFGGFDHNAQSLRIVTHLEDRYPEHMGLNLTIESLEGILKHNGPIVGNIPKAIYLFDGYQTLELGLYAGIEAQIAAICDDIAYNAHDIDDGIRAGLFSLEALSNLDFCGRLLQDIRKQYPSIGEYALKHTFLRHLISFFVDDLVHQTEKNIEYYQIESHKDIQQLGQPLVTFSEEGNMLNQYLKHFLLERMYRHPMVNRMASKAKRVIDDLCDLYIQEPNILPHSIYHLIQKMSPMDKSIFITDFIAGMTDKFALEEHKKLFDLYV